MILEPVVGLGHGYLLGDDGFAPMAGGVTFQPAVRVGRADIIAFFLSFFK